MATLKRMGADGKWEYIQLTGQDVSTLITDVNQVQTDLADMAKFQSNMWVDVAKDYGTTSTAIQNAINFVQTRGKGTVFLSPLYTFTVTSEISFDVSKVSVLGGNTLLDCTSLTSGNALRLYSSVV